MKNLDTNTIEIIMEPSAEVLFDNPVNTTQILRLLANTFLSGIRYGRGARSVVMVSDIHYVCKYLESYIRGMVNKDSNITMAPYVKFDDIYLEDSSDFSTIVENASAHLVIKVRKAK